jgi:hypothetical protein
MTIELYAAPTADFSEAINSPISNTTGELPDQEPTLDLGALLGSFDSQEEALAFIQSQFADQHQRLADSRVVAFDAYTHVSGLMVTVQNDDQSTERRSYYLVTDEGY